MSINLANSSIKKPQLLIAYFLICCVICFSPYFANQSRMIPCLFILLCFGLVLISSRKIKNNALIPFILFVILDFFYQFVGLSVGVPNSICRMAFFSVLFIFTSLNNSIDIKESKRLFFIVFVIVLANVISNIWLGIKYPAVSLLVISGAEFKDMNVGGTWFSVVVLLFLNICALMALNLNKLFQRLLFWGGAFLSFVYLIFYGMRGSVVLFMLISLFFLLFYKYTRISPIIRYLAVILFVLVVLQVSLNSDAFFDFLYKITPEGRLQGKIRGIQSAADYGVDEDSFSNRWGLYMLSLHTWMDNPQSFLFGIGEDKTVAAKFGYDYSGLKIGGHSDFLDAFAKWGVLGVSFILWYIVVAFKYIMNQFNDREIRKQVRVILLTFFLCFTFKVVLYTDIALLVFFLLPLSAKILNNK